MTGHPNRIVTPHAQGGFTLVVIAALFIAFATVAAVIIERNTATQFMTRREAAKKQLQRLNYALIEYSVYNMSGSTRLYPCPAATNLLTTSISFGASVNNGSGVDDCSTVSHAADGIIIPGSPTNTDVIKGMVPVQALAPYGINQNDAFDPWNNRIMYVVNRQLTTGGSKSTTNNANLQYVIPIGGTWGLFGPNLPPLDFILISYGRDGVGGIRRGATSVGIPCPGGANPASSANLLYAQNCSLTGTYYIDTPTYTQSAATSTTYFDDILSYHSQ